MLRTIQFVAVTAAALCIGAAPAFSAPKNQEPAFEEPHGADLNQGKPPSEIFKSDCSVCHKSPQGLAKGGGVAGLQSFLRQHYTTGAPQAAAMASYLASVGGGGSAKPVSPTRPEKPEKPERASPEHQRPAVARRPAAGEPANDGLITPNSAKPEAEPAHPARRGVKPEKPEEPKQAPARARAPKIEEAKPAEPDKREVVSEPAPRSSEPAAAPAPEPKPAAPAVPEIPL